MKAMRDQIRRCPCCGLTRRIHYGRNPVCQPCRALAKAQPTDEHALTGGRWVARGLIRVWVPDESEAA